MNFLDLSLADSANLTHRGFLLFVAKAESFASIERQEKPCQRPVPKARLPGIDLKETA